MATAMTARRHRADSFRIHEDAPSTEDTEMNESALLGDGAGEPEGELADDDGADCNGSECSESSEDEAADDRQIHYDMERLQNTFAGFRQNYRLIKRIGEGTFSTVYKAEDLQYDNYDNSWDLDKDSQKWTPPPLRSFPSQSSATVDNPSHWSITQSSAILEGYSQLHRRRKPRYVAVKKIYVTSSPSRIFNELDLLHDLRGCTSVCPLITAFRSTDQVVAILPYFRHADFRNYFRDMTVQDMAIYLRSLFTALASVHSHKILHRDIKPTNFLYDPPSRRGVLVDFGLAEREGTECKPCFCHESPQERRARVQSLISLEPRRGFPREDTRPSRRANRAGTRGFRAPEVLFKCTEQTTKIDVWSAGVILLTILSRRFPFFNSADDVEAMIEMATMFGLRRMQRAASLHGCMLESNIPTIGRTGFTFPGIILWSTDRSPHSELADDEKLAAAFLGRCMDLDPRRRISAEEALQHEFLRMGLDSSVEGASDAGDDEELDLLRA